MIVFSELFLDGIFLFAFEYLCAHIIFEKKNVNLYRLLISLLFFSLVLALLNCTNIEVGYGILKVLFTYLLMCLFLYTNYKYEKSKNIIMSLIYYLCIFASEVITVIISSGILEKLNSSISLMKYNIILNLIITTLSFLIVIVFKDKFKLILNNINFQAQNNFIIVIILITMSLLVFKIPLSKWSLNIDFIVTMLILLCFCIVGIYLIKQNSDINKTSSMYQHVVKYSNTTNKVLEDYRMISHEHKNQLSIIRQMVPKNNKELIEYLDNLMNKYSDIKYKWVSELNKLPSDGLKGLINYKLVEMDDNGIKSTVTISKEVSKIRLNKLNTTQKDHLYSICGVYLDNAIQAAIKGKEKEIAIDIYKENKDLVFVIANTYKGKIELGKIDDYGYSTKGKNHGIGLHLVKTILNEDKLFSQERKIIDKYYVQELRLHTSELNNKYKK